MPSTFLYLVSATLLILNAILLTYYNRKRRVSLNVGLDCVPVTEELKQDYAVCMGSCWTGQLCGAYDRTCTAVLERKYMHRMWASSWTKSPMSCGILPSESPQRGEVFPIPRSPPQSLLTPISSYVAFLLEKWVSKHKRFSVRTWLSRSHRACLFVTRYNSDPPFFLCFITSYLMA